MLDVGRFRVKTCGGVTRRSFLRIGASMPLAGGLPAFTATARASELIQAKSVVFIWLWGGPSHIDTFDPKPNAPSEYRGPLAPISTRVSGVQFSELLPKLAQRNNLFSVLRSNVTSEPGHPDAGNVGLTGSIANPEPAKPNFGAIVAKHRGHKGVLSPFVYVGRVPADGGRPIEGYGGGLLGKTYDPFVVSCSERGQVDIPSLKLLDELTPNRISDRKSLLVQLDNALRAAEQNPLADWEQSYQRAYGLLTNPQARNAFDLTRESSAIRSNYGQTTFGQSCLMARRLVEAGIPYIQVNWSECLAAFETNGDFGWDTHIYNFEMLQDRHCPIFDRALSVFLDELDQRGLLETTLVVVMGEFGRTPKINERAARDHWIHCYCSLWAGAGLEPGRVVGESDRLGRHPVTTPATPLMVGTTIAQLAGLNSQTRAELKVLEGGEVIDGL